MTTGIGRTALMATAAIVCVASASPAFAQTKSFDVPAQAVQTAIGALGRQGDIQIVAIRKDTKGKRANAVRGNMTVEQALAALLEGTGLVARRTGPQTYSVVKVASAATPRRQELSVKPARQDPPATGEAVAGSAAANDESADAEILGREPINATVSEPS